MIQLHYYVYTWLVIYCQLNSEGVLKVTGSHVYFKSGSISKTVLDKRKL